MPKQPFINSSEDASLRLKTIRDINNASPNQSQIKSVKTTSNSAPSVSPAKIQDKVQAVAGENNTKIIETRGESGSTIVIETSKDVYVNTIEDITEQKYITNQSGGIGVGNVDDLSYTNVVSGVSKLGFDVNSGFTVTQLGSGTAKIGITIPGNEPGGINTQIQFNNNGTFGGVSSATYDGLKLNLGSNTQVGITGGTSGQVLSTDGTGNLSWVTTQETNPGGCNTQMQYNNGGVFGGIPSATYDGLKLNLGNNTQVGITGGSSGQVLATDGSGNLSWVTTQETNPGGCNTQVQYNNGGVFAGHTGFTYTSNTGALGICNITPLPGNNLNVNLDNQSTYWYTLYGSFDSQSSNEYGSQTVADSDGNIYVVGADGDNGLPYLVKFSPSGTVIWQKQFTDINNYYKTGEAIIIDGNGDIYCTIGTDDAVSFFTIIKLNSAGNLLWSINVDDDLYSSGVSLAVDSNNNLVVAGFSDPKAVIYKFTSSGTLVWQNSLDTSYGTVVQVSVDISDGIYVTTSAFAGSSEALMVAYLNASGGLLWQNTYTEASSNITPVATVVDSSNNLYITGRNFVPGQRGNIFVLKLSNIGAIQWQVNLIGATTEGTGTGIDVDSLGNVYISGYALPRVGNGDLISAKISGSGTVLWQRTFGGSQHEFQWYYWSAKTLTVYSDSYSMIAITSSNASSFSRDLLVTRLPLDGSLTGVYDSFTYTESNLTVSNTQFSMAAAAVVYAPHNSPITASTISVSPVSYSNNLYPIDNGLRQFQFKTNGSFQTPEYAFPADDGNPGQIFTTNGSGSIGWSDLAIKLNSCGSLRINTNSSVVSTYGFSNIGVGMGALANMSGCVGFNPSIPCVSHSNIAIGSCSLCSNTTGSLNVAIGYGTLSASTTAYGNVAIGLYSMNCLCCGSGNTAVGRNSLGRAQRARNNVAIGCSSLPYHGSNELISNVAIGNCSGNISQGDHNVAIGCFSLDPYYGYDNIAIGRRSMGGGGRFSYAANNIAIGCSAAGASRVIASGQICGNIIIGSNAGFNICCASHNIIIGTCAGYGICTVQDSHIIIGKCAAKCGVDELSYSALNSVVVIGKSAGYGGADRNSVLIGAYAGSAYSWDSTVAIGTAALKCGAWGFGHTAIGVDSMYGGSSGSYNTAVGSGSMFCGAGSNGRFNVAIGYYSMASCKVQGSFNVAVGDYAGTWIGGGCYNTAVGAYALDGFSGYGLNNNFNTAIGYQALLLARGACANTAVGVCALSSARSACGNVAIGNCALYSTTTACSNVAIGNNSLSRNITGNSNVAVGNSAMRCNTIGINNIAIGECSLYSNISGSYNMSMGPFALNCNTAGNYNLALGNFSLYSNTTGGSNIALGLSALYSNTCGFSNIAIGGYALYCNTTACQNIAIGSNALYYNTTGCGNIGIGTLAGQCNSTGRDNIAIGGVALFNNVCSFNIGIGNSALSGASLAFSTIGVGYGAGAILQGNENIAIGRRALSQHNGSTTTGDTNIAIGFCAGGTLSQGCNNIILGANAFTATSTSCNTITLGNAFITCLRSQVTTISSLSDARDKTDVEDLPLGLEFILNLRPVKFTWNMRDGGKVGVKDSGFIAQEVAALEDIFNASDWLDMVGRENPEKLELKPAKLIPILVRAIQELNEKVRKLEKNTVQNMNTNFE